jgi:hypothetical protein
MSHYDLRFRHVRRSGAALKKDRLYETLESFLCKGLKEDALAEKEEQHRGGREGNFLRIIGVAAVALALVDKGEGFGLGRKPRVGGAVWKFFRI